MGVRSFILLALVGAIAGAVGQPMFTLGMVIFAASLTLFGYFRTSALKNDEKSNPLGLTTEIAAMATFGLGYFTQSEPFLSLALAAIILFILNNKTLVHTFVRTYLQPQEIQGGSVLLLLAVGVVPLIPDQTIDPLHIFNPHRLAMIIVLLAGIQFVGYIATRVFGDRIGLPVTGFFAGLASSTAVFVAYQQIAKNKPESIYSIASAAVFAVTASLFLIVAAVGAISWPLILGVSIPLGSLILISSLVGFYLAFKAEGTTIQTEPRNPLNLWSAIKLGLFLTVLLFVVDLTNRYLGIVFAQAVNFLAGLFELQGVIIANANLLANNGIALDGAVSAVLVAIIASMVSKIVITGVLARGTYRLLMLAIVFGLLIVSIVFWVLIRLMPALILEF